MTYQEAIGYAKTAFMIYLENVDINSVEGRAVLTANKIISNSLKNADKYRWHDLREYPEDLPMGKGEYLCAWVIPADIYMTRYDIFHFNCNAFTWYNDETDEYIECDVVVAWKYIEPFESEETKC